MLNPVIGSIGGSGGGSSGGPGTILVVKEIAAGSVTLSAAAEEIGGTTFSFIVPASRKALVTVNLSLQLSTATTTGSITVGVGPTVYPGAIMVYEYAHSYVNRGMRSARILVTATPGTVYSSSLYAKVGGGATGRITISTGGNLPASLLVIEV